MFAAGLVVADDAGDLLSVLVLGRNRRVGVGALLGADVTGGERGGGVVEGGAQFGRVGPSAGAICCGYLPRSRLARWKLPRKPPGGPLCASPASCPINKKLRKKVGLDISMQT